MMQSPQDKRSGKRRQGRSVLRWLGRIALGILVILLLLMVAGAAYQWFASAADQRDYPPPGQLVDVGGHRLHIVCAGEGSPTVILDALGDGASPQWGWVQPAVAKTTHVCAYDRAGRGWSEAGPIPRDGKTVAQDLHTLLANAKIGGPTVMVGHSYGGLIALIYAGLYTDDVAGMVLIDSGLPGLRSPRMPAAAHEQEASDRKLVDMAPWMARLGIFRLVGYPATLPEPQQSYAQAIYASNGLWDSLKEELQAMSLTDAEAGQMPALGNRPLLVVAATRGWADANAPTDESRQISNTMQQELLPLSTNSAYREVEGASHGSLVLNQTDAAQVSAAIMDVVDAVRNGTRLVP
jgi:pimeloyl-ACP methyl ester carboxylesterase